MMWRICGRTPLFLLCTLLAMILASPPGAAQEVEDNGTIVTFLEDQLSTPARQIRLSGIEGLLSSDARVGEITVADQAGVWLRITGAEIVWSRLALLGGALSIERLAAAEIAVLRAPLPDPTALPSPEATPFSVPELPISVEIGAVDIQRIAIAEELAGTPVAMSLAGALTLSGGDMTAKLALDRTDGQPGQIRLDTAYDKDAGTFAITLAAQEAQGGLVAGLMGLEGQPALALDASGDGPINDLDIALALAVAGQESIAGRIRLQGATDGLGFSADLDGDVTRFVSSDMAPFFEGQTSLDVAGVNLDAGGMRLDRMDIITGALRLTGSMETAADGFLRRASIDGRIGRVEGPVRLPVGGGDVTTRMGAISLDFGNDPEGAWSGRVSFRDLATGSVDIPVVDLLIGGTATDLDTPEARAVTLTAEGQLSNMRAQTADLQRALGRSAGLVLDTRWTAGAPLEINRFRVTGNGTNISAEGLYQDGRFEGEAAARIDRLQPFGGLAGRDLRGAVDIALKGSVVPLDGMFDLSLTGTSEALKLDIPALDGLMLGQTNLAGGIVRDTEGLRTRNLSLRNRQISIASDGYLASRGADLSFTAVLADLGDLTTDATGEMRLSGRALGTDGRIALRSDIEIASGTVLGNALDGFQAGFDGVSHDGRLTGTLEGRGDLADAPISLTGAIENDADGLSLDRFAFSVGETRISGDLNRDPAGLFAGDLALFSPNVSQLAALFLQDATGAATARIALTRGQTGQSIQANANLINLAMSGLTLGEGRLNADIENAFGVPRINGTLIARNAVAGGIAVATLVGEAKASRDSTAFDVTADLANAARISTHGALTALTDGYSLELDALDLTRNGPVLGLAAPTSVIVRNGEVLISRLEIEAGDGRVIASGRVSEDLALALDLTDLPLSVANAIRDDLELGGALSGTATVTGSQADPRVGFALEGRDISSSVTRDAGLPPIGLSVTGETEADTLNIAADLIGPDAFSARVTGSLPLGSGAMDIEGQLDRLPLALFDRVAGGPGMRGIVDGGFGVSGTFARPRIRFAVTAAGVSVRAMRDNGIEALRVEAEGSFRDDRITLPVARITGGGVDFDASGRIPLRLDGLDVGVVGTVPLSVASVILARAGTGASGTAEMSFTARGSLRAPVLDGRASLRNGSFTAPLMNLRLDNVAIDARLTGDRLVISEARGRNVGGGRVSASGSVQLVTSRGLPADLTATLRNIRYTNGDNVNAELGGELRLRGPITRRAELSGQLDLERLEFNIPRRVGGASDYRLDVRHVAPPADLRRTLARAGLTEQATGRREETRSWRLDVTLNAPSRVFVRGRGLDAELGGRIRVDGTLKDIRPEGRFSLQRGRFAILGQRLDLTAGEVVFSGNRDPELLLRARTIIEDVEATVALEGPASAPEVTLSSVPDLPDDEILAQIVFRRALSDLSALQVARLAAALGELSGRTGPSFFEQIRAATGLDDLDIEQADDGTTTVRAGKYIRDNVYSVVEADNAGNSRATINLDISRDVTARGTIGSDGNTSLGIFFERDY